MWILPLIGYLGILLGFGFLTLAIASGLYYLSELVEEHTVIAKRILTRMIYGVMALQLLMWLFDGFPFRLSVLGIVGHLVYLGNMAKFPVVRLSSPLFISACVLVLVHHYFSFRHFSTYTPQTMRSRFDAPDYPSFSQIASYFGICVWLVPFSLFVSLSASDNVLPTMSSSEPTGLAGTDGAKNGRQGMAKVLVDKIRDAVGEATKTISGNLKTDRDKGF